MTNATKSAFGSDYLDTTNNKSAVIRSLFKDWDKQVFTQEFNNKLDEKKHIELYKKQIVLGSKKPPDTFKMRTSNADFMHD